MAFRKESPATIIATPRRRRAASTLARRSAGDFHAKPRPSEADTAPILADGRIYFFREDGQITVLRPDKKYEELAKSRIDGRLMATPAVADKAMFIRTDTHLYRYE